MKIEVLRTGPFSVNTCIVNLDDKNVIVVDPANSHFTGDRNVIVDFFEQRGLSPLAVILTHGHFDHVSGLKSLREDFPEIPIFIHKNDMDFIGKNSEKLQGLSLMLMGFDDFLPTVSNLPEANGFLEDGASLYDCFVDLQRGLSPLQKSSPQVLERNSLMEPSFPRGSVPSAKLISALKNWIIIHTPGHTPGSVCLYNKEEKVLIAGDTVFYHSWGRTDLPMGSEDKIQESLRKIYQTLPAQTVVYPGHDRYGFRLQDNLS